MKRILFLTAIPILFLLHGCSDDPVELNIRFFLTYQDEPLIMLQNYSYPDGRLMRISRVSFYLSDIAISTDDGMHEISDVAFLDLSSSHATADAASRGFSFYSEILDMDRPDRLTFNVGLTNEQNSTSPSDYTSDHPLSRTGEYWTGWQSYIYVKVQGMIDLDNDGDPETGMALHLGSEPILRTMDLNFPDDSGSMDVVIDIRRFFEGDRIFDIDSSPQIHSLEQIDAAIELIDNFCEAIQVRAPE